MRRTLGVVCAVAVVLGACADDDVGDGDATGTTDGDTGTVGGVSSTGAESEASSEASAADTSTSTSTTGPAGNVGFADVSPIYNQKCGPCHVTASFGGHNLGSADLAVGFGDSQLAANSADCDGLTKGACSLVRIQSGSMPMGLGCTGDPTTDADNESCLTAEEQSLVAAWIEGGQEGP